MSFKETHTEEKRKLEYERIQTKYSERKPVIVEINPLAKDKLPPLKK